MSTRKILTPKQKIAILREHLIEKVPVSEICDKHGVSVVNFYNWQKQLFENGVIAFERKTNWPMPSGRMMPMRLRSKKWKPSFSKKNEVIAELLQEHVGF